MTAFVTIFTLALLMVIGLVLDGGFVLATRREADAAASAAARAGAQAVSIDELRRTGGQRVDPTLARRAVDDFLARTGHTGRLASVDGGRVTVEVEIRRRLLVLGIGGLTARTITGEATARSVRGVTRIES